VMTSSLADAFGIACLYTWVLKDERSAGGVVCGRWMPSGRGMVGKEALGEMTYCGVLGRSV